jgi:hypothetical protein
MLRRELSGYDYPLSTLHLTTTENHEKMKQKIPNNSQEEIWASIEQEPAANQP